METHQRPLFQHLILIVPCWFRMKFRLIRRLRGWGGGGYDVHGLTPTAKCWRGYAAL